MSLELRETEPVAVRPVTGHSLQDVMTLGKVFKASGYFRDIRDEAQAVTKILYGREMGFTPIVSIMGIYIIEGKPSLSSNLLASLVRRSGKYDYRVIENSAARCAIEFRVRGDRGDWEVLGESEFTMDDAKTAGMAGKDNWKKYPKAMLFARALSAGVRTHCPDVSMCPIYVPEELGATVTEDGEVTELPKSARPVEVTQVDIPLDSAPANSGSTAAGKGPAVTGGTPRGQFGGQIGGSPVRTGPAEADGGNRASHVIPPTAPTEPTVAENVKAALLAEKRTTTALPSTDADGTGEMEPQQYIDLGQQRFMHRTFREHLRADLQANADELLRDWLRIKGLLKDGKPSTKGIESALFTEFVKEAQEWAKGL